MNANRRTATAAGRLTSRALRSLPASGLRVASLTAGCLAHLSFRTHSRTRWQAGWRSLSNKLDIFLHYEHAARLLRLPKGPLGPEALEPALRRARRFEAPRFLWLTEGVGRVFTERRQAAGGEPPEGLMQEAEPWVNPSALLPLHLGMGLCLAERCLQTAHRSRALLADTLRQFTRLCRRNSVAGFEEVASESLGLIARLLFPGLVADIDAVLRRRDERARRTFRHGVGRGLYFVPSLSMPLPQLAASWRRREIQRFGDADAMGDLVSGLCQARILANLRHPDVVCTELAAARPAPFDATTLGAESALATWRRVGGEDAVAERLLAYRPDDPDLCRNWMDQVVAPGERGFRTEPWESSPAASFVPKPRLAPPDDREKEAVPCG